MRKIKEGHIYKHFKGDMYLVLCIAQYSEDDTKLVVYKSLYGEYKIYARPYEMFASEVDHKKYPKVKQKYRFQEVRIKSLNNK